MHVFVIGKCPDKTIIKAFELLRDEYGGGNWSFRGNADFTDALETLKLSKTPTYAIFHASITPKGANLTVQFRRSLNGNADPYFDEIGIEANHTRPPSPEDVLRVEQLLRSQIKFPNPSHSTKTERQVSGVLEKEISTIASMHQKLLADALELRNTYELQDAERRAEFEQLQRQKEAALKEEEQASHDRISKEMADLDAKMREFDFSDHMRARRALREQITLEVQSSLKRPISSFQSTYKLILVTAVSIAGALVSGFFAFESFQSFIALADGSQNALTAAVGQPDEAADIATQVSAVNDKTYLLWMLAIRGFALSAVAVAFTYYLISLYRKSYDEEIRTLRELQRYGMDINRASWVIETAMEMTTKENAQLPDKWIEGACAGLFHAGPSQDGEVSSLAALGAVMGLGPEIDAGPDGVRFKLPSRATKKAAKEAE